MTPQERQASGGVFPALPRDNQSVAPRRDSTSTQDVAAYCTLQWEDIYRNASFAQQRELLSLANRQGILYSHQIATSSGGAAVDPDRRLLAALLSGRTEALEPLRPTPISVYDSELDGTQREAVAKAVQTQDIFLLQGLPGTGKSRVVAEITAQAAARGERILLVAPTTPSVDRVLEIVHAHETICALRCLGPDERADRLPPSIRALTFSERLRAFREESLASVWREVTALENRLERCCREEPLWNRLADLAECQTRLQSQLTSLQQRRLQIPEMTERAAAAVESQAEDVSHIPFAEVLTAAVDARKQALAETAATVAALQTKVQKNRLEEEHLARQQDALRPLVEAKQQKRWWTTPWWRATFVSQSLTQAAELQTQLEHLRNVIQIGEQEIQRLLDEQSRLHTRFQTERSQWLQSEIQRRQAELSDQEAALQQEICLIEEKGQAACQELKAEAAPAKLTCAAVEEARLCWARQVQETREQLARIRPWAEYLRDNASSLPERLLQYVNLVATSIAGLQMDEHFGETSSHATFDLLILEGADEITESEFLRIARRARRWILVGGPPQDVGDEDLLPTRAQAKPARPTVLRPGFFQRLWQQLHCDPRRLPYTWTWEGERLCCQLRPSTAEQRASLESERVADFPDIELRILTLPRMPPILAEVVFPPSMSIYQAKEYIFQELQEVPVRAQCCRLAWVEEPDRLLLQLADAPASATMPVLLEQGVRERVAIEDATANGDRVASPQVWHTCCIEFDRSSGWHREKAEEWVARYLGLRDLGRTVPLDTPYRMQAAGLAVFLSDLLFDGAYRCRGARMPSLSPSAPVADSELPVVFVPVPDVAAATESSERGTGAADASSNQQSHRYRAVLSKGGAGLETDLAGGHRMDRLPDELRARLPRQGIVNYLEAQVVVRTLEALVSNSAILQRSSPGTNPCLGVMALHAAQVELLRLLIAQSPILAAATVDIQVDIPYAFCERECWTVLLSLARSHTHRAVSFGEGPHLLALALTRAQSRLILFGDPGTLVRRCQWEGPVDNLDEAASARERKILAQLLHYLQGRGANPHVFSFREGSGVI